jgi:hypothetical protein
VCDSIGEMIERHLYRRSSRREVREFLMDRHGRTPREAALSVRHTESRGGIRTIGGGYTWTGTRWVRLEDWWRTQ